jgi:branched-chain amino acid transport system permease protein
VVSNACVETLKTQIHGDHMPPAEFLFQQMFNGLMLGTMYALIAVGFTLFFGVLDVVHFSHGDIFMFGAFAGLSTLGGLFALSISMAAIALPLAFLASILITGIVGVAAERVCVKPLARSSPLMTLLATLSLGLVVREAFLNFYPRGADPKPFPQMLTGGGFDFAGVLVRYDSLAILAIGFGAMVVVDLIINRTRMGIAIRAVAQDPEAARMMGVNLNRTVDTTFFIGSGLAAVAGILSGLYYGEIHFIMGIAGGVIGFSAAAIGGFGNVYGAILGGLLFGQLQTLAAAFIPRGSEFRDVIAFAVVMLFITFRPRGILGDKSVERA